MPILGTQASQNTKSFLVTVADVMVIGGGGAGGNGGNTVGGGGGGCGSPSASVAGGSGLVIIRYPDSNPDPASYTGSKHTSGGYKYFKFVETGSITF